MNLDDLYSAAEQARQERRFDHVKDSGAREHFETGSRRDTREGKGRFDLMSVIALRRDARHYENGAVKYGDRNWEKGQPCSRYLDSAMRHLVSLLAGDKDEDHAAAVRWNVAAFMHTEELAENGDLPAELLDLPWQEDAREEALDIAERAWRFACAQADHAKDIECVATSAFSACDQAGIEHREASDEFADELTHLLRARGMCGPDDEVLEFNINVGSMEKHLSEQEGPATPTVVALEAFYEADGTLCILTPKDARYVRMVPQS